jgi:hypothetical protein
MGLLKLLHGNNRKNDKRTMGQPGNKQIECNRRARQASEDDYKLLSAAFSFVQRCKSRMNNFLIQT